MLRHHHSFLPRGGRHGLSVVDGLTSNDRGHDEFHDLRLGSLLLLTVECCLALLALGLVVNVLLANRVQERDLHEALIEPSLALGVLVLDNHRGRALEMHDQVRVCWVMLLGRSDGVHVA